MSARGTAMKQYTDLELEYAATGRCRCGAGLAHPLDPQDAFAIGSWVCSEVLKGAPLGEHESLPFAYWKVREESSINNLGNLTTRPAGTRCMTQGEATCPKCETTWQSEPYLAGGLSHHWFCG